MIRITGKHDALILCTLRLQQVAGDNCSHGMRKNVDFLYSETLSDVIRDALLIRQKQLISIFLLKKAQFRRTHAVPTHVGTNHGKSSLLQFLRKRIVALLVFLHAMNDLHTAARIFRLENMQV